MLKSRRLLGLTLIDVETGKGLGRVQRFILDPKARRVVALVVTSGPWARDEQVLLWEHARGVGPAAVTVAGAHTLTRASQVPQLQPLLRRQVRTYGARVLTEDGSLLGTVEELVLDPRTGEVVEFLLASNGLKARLRPPLALPAQAVVVIGEDAVVAREGARPYPFRPGRPGADARPPAPVPPVAPHGHGPGAALQRLVSPLRRVARQGREAAMRVWRRSRPHQG